MPDSVSNQSRGKDKNTKGRQPKSPKERVIRIFISSTFRDMHEERDELVLRIFPQLRKLCEKREVVWGEVDLRWGITDEKKAEGKVLPTCLALIDRCRPYFIGILGECYGSLPEKIPEELLEREGWLKEHGGKSNTELEIIHGVLNNPKMADHAYFYFRDPAYIDSLPKDKQEEYREDPRPKEIQEFGEDEAKRRAEDRKKKLAALKEKIKASGLPLRENYKNPKELGKLVLEDITRTIESFPPPELDPLKRIAFEHETFAKSRFGIYIGGEKYFETLDKHAKNDGPPLVIIGESGSGKSALLSNWAMDYREKHPEELFIMHFIGATADATDWVKMLRRIMGELKRKFDIPGEIPEKLDKPDELRLAFANWLNMASVKGRVIIIIDALNQLEDVDGAPDLVWLPPVIPPNIRIILSTLPGRPLDDLKKRGWLSLQIQPLDKDERKELIREYLMQLYSRKLSEPRIEKIASADQTHNPLFLRALLEELRVFGIHEKLEEKIDYYLEAKDVPELYVKILKRYEQDYERDRPGLVRDSMTLIWGARRGLTEKELLDILGENGNPLPQAYWADLGLAAEQALVSRSGFIGFFHDYMRQAVKNRFMPTEKDQQDAHLRLADYFSKFDFTHRVIDEYPWQLAEGRDWKRLYELLANLDFFPQAWEQNHFEVKSYWSSIEEYTSLRKVKLYQEVIRNPKIFKTSLVWYLGILLIETGCPNEAFFLLQFLIEYYRKENDFVNLQACLGDQAVILKDRGDLDESLKLLKEQEQICRDLDQKFGLCLSLGNQALILTDRGNLDEAMILHKEEEHIYRQINNKLGLSRTLGNQVLILYMRNQLDEAMKLSKEQEKICRELGDPVGLHHCLGNQALIHKAWGELREARDLQKKVEQICRVLGDKVGLSASLVNQANIYYFLGKFDKALELLDKAVLIYHETSNKSKLSIALINKANILYLLGHLDEAMKIQKEAEYICKELGYAYGLSLSYVNQALILSKKGQLMEGISLAEKAYQIATKYGLLMLAEGDIKRILNDIRSDL